MSEHKTIRTLFVGLGNSRVCYYRVVLPAMYIGSDWMGLVGKPPRTAVATSYVQGQTKLARFEDYDVCVLQQARGSGWFKIINNLREQGKVVLYECDDYVHGIRKSNDHDFKQYFDKDSLKEMELCMRAADGMICSTEYIARRYRGLAGRTWVCENGLDMGRYRLTRPPRGDLAGKPSVTLMWSGATGHARGTEQWMAMVGRVMDDYPHVCFASIGQGFGEYFREKFAARSISIPFAALETYPAAMMLGDIALAPAGQSSWYRAKSGLRAMEAAALGIPVVADLHYDGEVEHAQTGFVATDVRDAEEHVRWLVENDDQRELMGARARQHAEENFDMRHRREAWKETIIDAWTVCHG